jgi:two-component system nitrogen regulation sensor histidine kinase NtrY
MAIGEGERAPELEAQPPVEFRHVFAAFRRMAEDLDAGRRALEAAQRRTVAVLRNTASGVVATDREGNVTLANPRAELLLGRPLAPGTPLRRGDRLGLGERVQAFLAGTLDEDAFELERPGRQMRGQLTRLLAGGGGCVVTLDDVTELARAQRVLAWGEMARQVAHEIKNPLTPIRLGVQHLKRAYRDERVDYEAALDQNVGRILAEIDRLDEIARAFSRYGTAPAERPRGEPLDVADVVRDVVELERMGEGSVTWRLEDADAPAIAVARDHELREVLLNVLENARLAGAREVHVRLARGDGHVRIIVDDDGEGVPEDVLPRVFEPHFSTRTSGSGLGLAISRTLVDGWGGEITLERLDGRGTRVRVTLAAPGPIRHY